MKITGNEGTEANTIVQTEEFDEKAVTTMRIFP